MNSTQVASALRILPEARATNTISKLFLHAATIRTRIQFLTPSLACVSRKKTQNFGVINKQSELI